MTTQTALTAHQLANKRLRDLGLVRHDSEAEAVAFAGDLGFSIREALTGQTVAIDPEFGASAILGQVRERRPWSWQVTRAECLSSRCVHEK